MDIATGIGEPAVTAAEVVGDSSTTTTTNGDSHVLAIDISSQMLAIAKKRSIFLGCKDLAFGNGQISKQRVVASMPNYDPHNLIHTNTNNNITYLY